ncbi:MAG: hypothetical protein IT365_01540 [Candidatus Hydrogenedentes bacterium]|nr:hypothetical protein [Candidatus Hydrogenedentota bacterium]
MGAYQSTAGGASFRDFTPGLIIFGILELLFGGLCALLALLMVVNILLSSAIETPGAPMNAQMMVPGLLFYGLLAAWFITMGIGSMLARRWARTLVLVSSWVWLICGIAGLIAMVAIMPAMMGQMGSAERMPQGFATVMMAFMYGFLLFFYILIPGALVLFFGNRNVKATCEFKDPVVRWTDHCPLPVLALCLLFAIWGGSLLMMGSYGWIFPVFGHIVSGAPGAILCLALATAFGVAAWGAYRLDIRAWWGALILFAVWFASLSVTFIHVGFVGYMDALYERMSLPPAQMDMVRGLMASRGSALAGFGVVWCVAFLGYLFYVRRYFVHSAKS